MVLTAHIDTKKGTPGALDNASGVAVLLAVGEKLRDYSGGFSVELAFLNGEDHYAVPGQMLYLASQEERWGEIRLATNLDGVGYREGKTAYSFYECPEELEVACANALAQHEALTPGDAWVQGDHSMFAMNGVPAMALTSDKLGYLTQEIVHTDRDRVELLNPEYLGEIADAVMDCIAEVDRVA